MKGSLRRSSSEDPRERGGAILLECVLALSIFVAAGLSIVALAQRSSDAVHGAAQTGLATDIASSVLAQVEAGILSPEAAKGGVEAWMESSGRWKEGSGSWGRYRVTMDVQPSSFEGLIVVNVRVFAKEASVDGSPLIQLYQVMPLRNDQEDSIGSPDEVGGIQASEVSR